MLVPPSPEPPGISGIGYHSCYHWQNFTKKTPLFRDFSGNLPETTAQKYHLSRENSNTHAAPHAFEWGGGGGGVTDEFELQLTKTGDKARK